MSTWGGLGGGFFGFLLFLYGEARLTGQDVLVSVLALVFRSLTLMTVKQLLGFLFLQTLRAEERIVMARLALRGTVVTLGTCGYACAGAEK